MTQLPEDKRANADAYAAVVESLIYGMIRIRAARAAHLTFTVALLNYRSDPTVLPGAHHLGRVLKEIESVSFLEYDAYSYVGNFGHLVYATTLFDTFLSDTTRFLLLMFPKSIGKSQGVTIDEIVGAKSTIELIRAAAEKRAREISYKTFLDRIAFLKEQYGIGITLDDESLRKLEHYSSMRNVMIHDQGLYDFDSSSTGAIKLVRKTCPAHPRPVSSDDTRGVTYAYESIAKQVCQALYRDVFKLPSHPVVAKLSAFGAPPAAV